MPGAPFSSDAKVADACNRIVDRDGNVLRIYDPDGKAVADIGIWNGWTPPKLTISLSGRYVAFVDEDPDGHRGQEFHVLDVRDGTRRATIKAGAGYHSQANLVWSADETSLFAFRKEGEDTYIDRFVVPRC